MNILLAEDEKDSRNSLSVFLRGLGYSVEVCENGAEALELFSRGTFNIVLTDIKMPMMNGIELLKKLKHLNDQRDFDVVIFTGHGDLESAIEALRYGARDYLLKPINIRELAVIIERIALNQAERQAQKAMAQKFTMEVQGVAEESNQQTYCFDHDFINITGVGEIGILSDRMKEIYRQALKFHDDRTIPALIEGETGTGKEAVARLIHYGYMGTEAPFVDINCATLTPNLFESELFGYEAGAYTGGLTKGNKGKIDLAAGGTLFLDEIGEMSIDLQAKLLRVIQEKEFYRVGGLKKIKADIRLICATNVNLKKRAEQGLFRTDLFYRLNVGTICLPPLRERKDEIRPLSQKFLKEFAAKKGKKFKGISDEAAAILNSYNWPGNIRELRNVVEWVVFNHDDFKLKPAYLDIITKIEATVDPALESKQSVSMGHGNLSLPPTGLPLGELVHEVILRALEMHNFNKAKTARYLGISRNTLYYHLEKLDYSAKTVITQSK